jgi:carbamoyltransferase
MRGSYLGPSYAQREIEARLTAEGAAFAVLDDDALFATSAADIVAGRALGWCQGAAEFGPRALGNRSIVADARSAQMQSTLNLKVKFRESFRPFAPAVLKEDAADWFDLDCESPYMLLVAQLAKQQRIAVNAGDGVLEGIARLKVPRSTIPAVTHVDGSARVQTVDRDTNPRFHRLLSAFKALTGCPVVVNTSFNVRGEPPVLTPEDAFRCFMGTGIEVLVFGNCYLRKDAQNPGLARDYRAAFAPD